MTAAPALATRLHTEYTAFAKTQQFALEPATLYEPIRYALATPGKGVRPLLLLLAHALGGEPPAKALEAAFAIELFHNFTLVHDDIMDRADLRRGRPSVHRAYDEPTAILAGDAMLIHTYGYLIERYPHERGRRALATFQQMAQALCAGQQRDMDMEHADAATYAGYLEMIHGKTGALITAALVMGAQLGGLTDGDVRAVRTAGDLAGRAFQIQDDLLDTFRTSAVTGKMNYGDIVRGKLSAPYLKALELASGEQAAWLAETYAAGQARREQRLDEILALYGELGVEKSLSAEVARLSAEATAHLSDLAGDAEAREALVAFTKKLAGRNF